MSNEMSWRFRVWEVASVLFLVFTIAAGWWSWAMLAWIVGSFAVFVPIVWKFFPVYFGLKEAPPQD